MQAFRARTIVTMQGEAAARGAHALDAPLARMDNAVLLIQNGVVVAVEKMQAFRRRLAADMLVTDLGDLCLAPGLVNAHCHLELSHLAGKTSGGKNFGVWMQSLIPLAGSAAPPELVQASIADGLRRSVDAGTAHLGDVGSRRPDLVAHCAQALSADLGGPYPVTHFLEAFGFGPPVLSPEKAQPPGYPGAEGYAPAAAARVAQSRYGDCAVAGHALYSTKAEALQAVFRWCRKNKRPFSMHLAESFEEEEALVHGKGALYELLRVRVLPERWAPPGLHPVMLAKRLGLLSEQTLAVHCVQCGDEHMALLAGSGAAVCLCPRSNAFINVGLAPAKGMALAGVLLCLGTDSLASNWDLDMRREMIAARDGYGLSPQAVLRMATVNGAHALGLPHLGSLTPGKAGRFALLRDWA